MSGRRRRGSSASPEHEACPENAEPSKAQHLAPVCVRVALQVPCHITHKADLGRVVVVGGGGQVGAGLVEAGGGRERDGSIEAAGLLVGEGEAKDMLRHPWRWRQGARRGGAGLHQHLTQQPDNLLLPRPPCEIS